MDLTTVYDCMGCNLGTFGIPPGVIMAGYATGNAGVPWTDAQWHQYPTALRIDQSPVNTPADMTADVLDIENQAATLANIPEWVHGAWVSYRTSQRPGQRTPTLYSFQTNLTPIANELNSVGITNGVNLFLSEPMTAQEAAQILETAGGPFPIVGVQYQFQATYDISLVSTAWLNTISGKQQISTPGPGTQGGWRYCSKCTGLFFGPQQHLSTCPVGGQHDGSHSHDYDLPFLV